MCLPAGSQPAACDPTRDLGLSVLPPYSTLRTPCSGAKLLEPKSLDSWAVVCLMPQPDVSRGGARPHAGTRCAGAGQPMPAAPSLAAQVDYDGESSLWEFLGGLSARMERLGMAVVRGLAKLGSRGGADGP